MRPAKFESVFRAFAGKETVEKTGCEIYFFEGGLRTDFHGDIKYYFTIVEWNFAYQVPIYAKNSISFDLNKYGKYYEKGKIIPVEWQLKAKCHSPKTAYETTYSGSYFIRITGECDSIPK